MEKAEFRGLIAFLKIQESEKNSAKPKQVVFYLASGELHGKYLTYDSDEFYVKIQTIVPKTLDELFIPFSSILAWGNGHY